MTKINKFFLALCLILPLGGLLTAQTAVPAIISSNQTWTAANSPYILSSNAIINIGASVKVMPGTVIQSTGNYRIIIEGEFIAEGTVDSVITIDKVKFEFTEKCVDYDFTNNSGSHFSYCYLIGNSAGGNQTIYLKNSNMLIDNCKFVDHYYTIYSMNSGQDSFKVQVFKTIFESKSSSSYGYAFYSSGSKTFLEMDECIIINQYAIFLPLYTKMTRSLVYNCKSYGGFRLSNYANSTAIFRCNTFRNFRNSVFELLSPNKTAIIDISNNTFDSADNFIAYTSYSMPDSMPIFEKNNFLTVTNYAFKFSGTSQAGISDSFNIRNNYWGSTDTNVIKAKIYDFSDDITVAALAHYSPFLSNPVYTCSEQFTALEEMKTSSFKMYPNPSDGVSTLNFNNNGLKTIRVFDTQGSLLFEVSTEESSVQLDLKAYPTGLYIIELNEAGKHASYQKLIVQN